MYPTSTVTINEHISISHNNNDNDVFKTTKLIDRKDWENVEENSSDRDK